MNDLNDISWFVGICDGEACFSMKDDCTGRRRLRPRFAVLMEEDKKLFDDMLSILGCGRLAHLPQRLRHDGGYNNPRWTLMVESKEDLLRVCQFFSLHRLRSHKAQEFEIWKALVDLWIEGRSGTKEALTKTLELADVSNRRGGQAQNFRKKIEGWLILTAQENRA